MVEVYGIGFPTWASYDFFWRKKTAKSSTMMDEFGAWHSTDRIPQLGGFNSKFEHRVADSCLTSGKKNRAVFKEMVYALYHFAWKSRWCVNIYMSTAVRMDCDHPPRTHGHIQRFDIGRSKVCKNSLIGLSMAFHLQDTWFLAAHVHESVIASTDSYLMDFRFMMIIPKSLLSQGQKLGIPKWIHQCYNLRIGLQCQCYAWHIPVCAWSTLPLRQVFEKIMPQKGSPHSECQLQTIEIWWNMWIQTWKKKTWFQWTESIDHVCFDWKTTWNHHSNVFFSRKWWRLTGTSSVASANGDGYRWSNMATKHPL